MYRKKNNLFASCAVHDDSNNKKKASVWKTILRNCNWTDVFLSEDCKITMDRPFRRIVGVPPCAVLCMKRIIAQYSTIYTVRKSHVRTRGDRGGARTAAETATAMSMEEEEEVKTLQTTQYPRVKRSSDFGRYTLNKYTYRNRTDKIST